MLAGLLETPSLSPCRMTLRPYQEEAIEAVRREFAAGRRSTLIVLPTGCGKTITFGMVARRCVERGGKVLILAHRGELIDQAADKLDHLGIQVGIEKAEQRARSLYDPDVVVATVQTMQRDRLKTWDRSHFRLIITDEAHHATSGSYKRIYEHFHAHHLGVTATADRADEENLGGVFESVAYELSLWEAMTAPEPGPYLCRLKFVQCDVQIDLRDIRTTAGDFNLADLEDRIRPLVETLANAIRQEVGARRTLIFTPDVGSAQAMATALQSLGLRADWVSGDDPERKEKVKKLHSGETQVLANCLDERTEILTNRGWVGIDDIRNDDRTAAVDPMNRAIRWEKVTRVVKRDRGDGERMVAIKNQTLDVRVTEGHRMLVRTKGAIEWRFVEAGELPGRQSPYQLPLAGYDMAPVPTCDFPLPHDPRTLTLDECRFIGLWIADGHIDARGGRGITIGQSAVYPDANEEIRRILTACGFDWAHSVSRNAKSLHLQHRYRVPRGNIGGALARNGFGRLACYLDKNFSPILFGLNREQALALIEGLWLGDGVKFKTRKHRGGVRRSWAIVNTNKVMLDRLQELAVTRGLAANICGPRDNGPLSTRPIYTICIRERAEVATNNSHVETSGGNPARFEVAWKPERVWCVTNKTGTIITRRNGKVAVMGQCALLTEGFDCPEVAAVALCRPTKSRPLYAQMVGRGTRLAKGKNDCLLIDFNYLTTKHDLVKPVELFDTTHTDSEVLEIATEMAKTQKGLDLVDAIERAEKVHNERQVLRIHARERQVGYRRVSYDPLSVCDALGIPWRGGKDAVINRATPKQVELLKKFKVEDAASMSKTRAATILDALIARSKAGLATQKQVAHLIRNGVEPGVARKMTFKEASAELDRLWGPKRA